MQRFLCLIFLLASGLVNANANPYRLYVSPQGNDTHPGTSTDQPLQSIEGARQRVRQLKTGTATGQTVEVNFMPGVYPMTEAVVFTAEDSGTENTPVIYQALEENTVFFSGGEEITGWKKQKDGIWVTTLPEVASGNWDFRQLYVNGKFKHRARTPNKGVFNVKSMPGVDTTVWYQSPCDEFEFFAGDIDPKWKDLTNGEVIVYHYWTDSHLPIASVDAKQNLIKFAFPAGKLFWDDFHGNLARYIVENVYAALDEPGEWVLNTTTGQLFYMPEPGQDVNSLTVIAPKTKEFIRMAGKPEERQYVEYVEFRNLNFQYSNYVLPFGDCNNEQASGLIDACINLTGVRNCAFTGCGLESLGTYAVELFEGCMENDFSYNRIEQVAAGGIRIRGTEAGLNPLVRTGRNNFSDNTIGYYGLTYPSAVGILLMHSDENEISHNHIHHGDYTGISIGWSWGYQRSATRNNNISYNHIHDIGRNNLLSDMGGIYTLGLAPGTWVRGNLVHDVDANRYGGWGIYMDEGTTSLTVEDNVVYNTKFGMFNIHYAKDVWVRNNIFAFGKLEQVSRERLEPHVSMYFENNIIYWKEGKLLAKDWNDKPYQFYKGFFDQWLDTATNIVSDWNIFYNPTKTLNQVDFNGHSWAEWQAMGRDRHSQYIDPLFVDPDQYDFRLLPESPVLKQGFRPLDVSQAGPRKR